MPRACRSARRGFTFVAVLLLASSAVAAASDPGAPPTAVLDARVGQPVPTVTLPDLEGAPRSLTELRGQRAMLHVFASW